MADPVGVEAARHVIVGGRMIGRWRPCGSVRHARRAARRPAAVGRAVEAENAGAAAAEIRFEAVRQKRIRVARVVDADAVPRDEALHVVERVRVVLRPDPRGAVADARGAWQRGIGPRRRAGVNVSRSCIGGREGCVGRSVAWETAVVLRCNRVVGAARDNRQSRQQRPRAVRYRTHGATIAPARARCIRAPATASRSGRAP